MLEGGTALLQTVHGRVIGAQQAVRISPDGKRKLGNGGFSAAGFKPDVQEDIPVGKERDERGGERGGQHASGEGIFSRL